MYSVSPPDLHPHTQGQGETVPNVLQRHEVLAKSKDAATRVFRKEGKGRYAAQFVHEPTLTNGIRGQTRPPRWRTRRCVIHFERLGLTRRPWPGSLFASRSSRFSYGPT